MFVLGLILGLLVGGFIGIFGIAMCKINKEINDNTEE